MNTWYRRHYPDGNYAQTFDLFENLYVGLGAPKDMFMISDRSARSTAVYISIPDHLKTSFNGFEPIANEDLPNRRAFLIGRGLEFERLFGHGKAFACKVCRLEARKAMIADEPTTVSLVISDDCCKKFLVGKCRGCAEAGVYKCPDLLRHASDVVVVPMRGDYQSDRRRIHADLGEIIN